jgi:hypothetical protein
LNGTEQRAALQIEAPRAPLERPLGPGRPRPRRPPPRSSRLASRGVVESTMEFSSTFFVLKGNPRLSKPKNHPVVRRPAPTGLQTTDKPIALRVLRFDLRPPCLLCPAETGGWRRSTLQLLPLPRPACRQCRKCIAGSRPGLLLLEQCPPHCSPRRHQSITSHTLQPLHGTHTSLHTSWCWSRIMGGGGALLDLRRSVSTSFCAREKEVYERASFGRTVDGIVPEGICS